MISEKVKYSKIRIFQGSASDFPALPKPHSWRGRGLAVPSERTHSRPWPFGPRFLGLTV